MLVILYYCFFLLIYFHLCYQLVFQKQIKIFHLLVKMTIYSEKQKRKPNKTHRHTHSSGKSSTGPKLHSHTHKKKKIITFQIFLKRMKSHTGHNKKPSIRKLRWLLTTLCWLLSSILPYVPREERGTVKTTHRFHFNARYRKSKPRHWSSKRKYSDFWKRQQNVCQPNTFYF